MSIRYVLDAENFSCLSQIGNTKIDKRGDSPAFGIPFINQLEPTPPNLRSSLKFWSVFGNIDFDTFTISVKAKFES